VAGLSHLADVKKRNTIFDKPEYCSDSIQQYGFKIQFHRLSPCKAQCCPVIVSNNCQQKLPVTLIW
jgi:hypothetical protein